MEIEFEKEYLKELYFEGRTQSKKTVDTLRNAPNIEFLYKLKSLHYEKKSGDLQDMEE